MRSVTLRFRKQIFHQALRAKPKQTSHLQKPYYVCMYSVGVVTVQLKVHYIGEWHRDINDEASECRGWLKQGLRTLIITMAKLTGEETTTIRTSAVTAQ